MQTNAENGAEEEIDAPHAIHRTLNYPTAGCRPANEEKEEEAKEEVSGEVGGKRRGGVWWPLTFLPVRRSGNNAPSCSSPPPSLSSPRDTRRQKKDVEKKRRTERQRGREGMDRR